MRVPLSVALTSAGVALSCARASDPKPDTNAAASTNAPAAGTPNKCTKLDGAPVELTTSDGVKLIADHYTTGTPGSPSALLLHMIPPHHDKSNYTPEFIGALRGAGYDVLNLNRRGAPGSDGDAKQAYEGPQGVLDAVAGVGHLMNAACRADPKRLIVVGASNGTTTALDYAVHAATDEASPSPRAMVFLSGGPYTENQFTVAEQRAAGGPLQSMPVYLAYPKAEAEWNDAQNHEASTVWTFVAFNPGDHGTKLFASDPPIIAHIVAWLNRLP